MVRSSDDIRKEMLKVLDIMERYMEILRRLAVLQGGKDIEKKDDDED